MKKLLFCTLCLFTALSMSAQETIIEEKILYEVDWSKIGPVYEIVEEPDEFEKLESVSDGLAITNLLLREHNSSPQVGISGGAMPLSLEQHHDYVVRMTLRIPTDGTYRVFLTDFLSSFVYDVAVKSNDDFQVIDVEFPDFGGTEYEESFPMNRPHIILVNAWVVGTTVLKKVEVIEKVRGTTSVEALKTAKAVDNTSYNLIGQKVNASYKGVVINNGKKMLMK